MLIKRGFVLTDDERSKIAEMSGNIMLWILEGRSTMYMAQQLNMSSWKVEYNIDEMLYILMRKVGKKQYLKMLLQR